MSHERKNYFNKPPLKETLAQKMQIATGMAGVFPPLRSRANFAPPKIRNSVQEAAIAEQMARDAALEEEVEEGPEFRRKGDKPTKFMIDSDQVTHELPNQDY